MVIVEMLSMDKPLLKKHWDHSLIGEWYGYRECHIKPDLLLLYKKYDDVLVLARMGSHSDLF